MSKKTILALAILSIFVTPIHASTRQPASVSFNVSHSPLAYAPEQQVTLYGCNNTVINTNLSWNSENQVLSNIPYGNYKSNTGKFYYIAKYYVVSPPFPEKTLGNQNPYLGMVIPHRFTFYGERPEQIINMNYQIFHSTYLADIPTHFNYMYKGKSCSSQKVNFIPINIQCKDLPWRNGAVGGEGIGLLSNNPRSDAFLPMLKKNKQPLQCTATLLDDIMLDYEVFFATKEGKSKSINLTKLYEQSKSIKLICIPRSVTDIPAGCVAGSRPNSSHSR